MKNMRSKVAAAVVALALSTATAGAAGADVLQGEDAPSQAAPACSATQNLVLETGSPMAHQKALALVGIDDADAAAELVQVQEAVQATCR